VRRGATKAVRILRHMMTSSREKTILTPEQANARTAVWRCLWESAAPLYWCPWETDAALNGACADRPVNIEAIARSVAADPTELLTTLRAPIQSSPFWTSTVRRLAIKHTALFVGNFPHLRHDAEELLWSEACRAAQSYAPVGNCANGFRPHYFHYYLRICLRAAVAAIRGRIDELKATTEVSSCERVCCEGSDSGDIDVLARDCGAVLETAVQAIQQLPELRRAYRLCVVEGLTVRGAAAACGTSKSSFQREAEALASALQDRFAGALGQRPQAKPDIARTFRAIRDILHCQEVIPAWAKPAGAKASAQV